MEVRRNANSSFRSTWRTADRSSWNFFHWTYTILAVYPFDLDKEVPIHSKQDKVPHLSDWQQHRWVLFHASIPVLLHQAYITCTGHNLGLVPAFLFYALALKLIAIHEMQILRRLGHTHGFLDGDKHERDDIPDANVGKVFWSLISTGTVRSFMAVFFAYRVGDTPSSINWAWLPLETALYQIVLDFWFYWYHRLMHDVEGLWKYHRTHHLTKHPNPLLALYADSEQELFDIFVVPTLAYVSLKLMGLPMGFYEYWICHQYVVFVELFGHSGIRVCASTPTTLKWVLDAFDARLVIEDHDIHHRRGWKKSQNYGKQTRLWDRIFGTCGEREECIDGNIDYENPATMPLF